MDNDAVPGRTNLRGQRTCWCFTLNNPQTFDIDAVKLQIMMKQDDRLRYYVFQLEKADTGTLHFQGYLEFSRSVRFSVVHKLFDGHAWITNRKGTRDQARNYCMKTDSRVVGPIEHGDWRLGGEGTRTDILAVTDRIQQGATSADISSEYPVMFVKYHRGFEKLVHYTEKQRTQPPEIVLLYGPTGTGKTKWCYDTHPLLYRKPCDTRWFDRYAGHTVLLLDDFGGAMSKMSLMYLLQLLDRYPLIVEAKGTHVNLMATTILITSNHHPRKWYNYEDREESYNALERRIHKVLYFPKFGTEPTDCSMPCFFANYYAGIDADAYVQDRIYEVEEESSESSTQTTETNSAAGDSCDDDVEYLGETSLGEGNTSDHFVPSETADMM